MDSSLRLSYGPLLAADGRGGQPARLSDVGEAEAVLVVGADPDLSHTVLALMLERAAMEGRARLVVVGTHGTRLSDYAACEIRHAPGEERQVLEWLHKRLSGGEGGEPREEVDRAAEVLESAKSQGSVVVIYGSGPMRRLNGMANRELIEGIAKTLSAKVMPLLSRANDRGAIEIAAAFAGQGLTTPEIFEAAGSGKMDLLYLVGEDVWPGSYDAKFVVVQDMFLPAEAGEIADVVLPGGELRGDRRQLHQPGGAGAEGAPRDPAPGRVEAGLGDPLQSRDPARMPRASSSRSPPRSSPSSPSRCPSSRVLSYEALEKTGILRELQGGQAGRCSGVGRIRSARRAPIRRAPTTPSRCWSSSTSTSTGPPR